MASPFRIFRKYKKMGFAILTVMAMIAFVFMTGFNMPTSREINDPVVVETSKFGNLRQNQIGGLMSQRQQLLSFLTALGSEARLAGATEGKLEEIRNIIGPALEQFVVEKWLLARQAEAMGIVVNDAAINEFLRDITSDRVPPDKIIAVLHQPRSAMSEPQLFAILREELLALRLRTLFYQLPNQNWYAGTIPPAQRWDYFKRLNRFASVELCRCR